MPPSPLGATRLPGKGRTLVPFRLLTIPTQATSGQARSSRGSAFTLKHQNVPTGSSRHFPLDVNRLLLWMDFCEPS